MRPLVWVFFAERAVQERYPRCRPWRNQGVRIPDVPGPRFRRRRSTAPAAVPLVKNKQARAIAVTSAERVGALPDVPTLNESALPGYVAVGWNGLVGPACIPAPVLLLSNASTSSSQ